jgi:glucan phosphoethanolaminetransferase (alkaline phosphatase superfamily)
MNNKYFSSLFMAVRLFLYQYFLFQWFINSPAATTTAITGAVQFYHTFQPLIYLTCLILPIMVLCSQSVHKHRRIWELLFIVGLCFFFHYTCVRNGIMPPLQRMKVTIDSLLNEKRPDYSFNSVK